MSPLGALASPALDNLELRATARQPIGGADQARKTGLEFEQMFLAQMLQPMFDALPSDGMFGGGAGERLFRSFQVDEYAKAITRTGGIGIADAVARHIITLQEKSNG
ncbi:MAG TPA: rod-binding protein [Alphaproteobacteria bacterium]|nr:rod-binding protein [Alphaproteobacteria bacterium]